MGAHSWVLTHGCSRHVSFGLPQESPAWGGPRVDTVLDAIMSHYTSQRAPGTFDDDLITDVEGPIARLLGSCQVHAANTKVTNGNRGCSIRVLWGMLVAYLGRHTLYGSG